MRLPKIALGAWSWGVGAAGGDQVFGNHLFDQVSSAIICTPYLLFSQVTLSRLMLRTVGRKPLQHISLCS